MFPFFLSSTIFRRKNPTNFKKLLTYKSKCAGAFSDHIRQPPNAPLTLWVDRLGNDRVLAVLIGCTPDSLPLLAPILTSWTGSGPYRLFYHVAVLPSMKCGLMPKEHLTVSGDGTAAHTHACPRGHHREGAPEHLWHFPDPDVSWGWDSDMEKYYFGYTLFQLSCYNSELRTDIPLLLRFTSARRHDSVC